ncbi:MAG TPA: tetratricopeptide repeat protein [Desulfobaccales bacterium]
MQRPAVKLTAMLLGLALATWGPAWAQVAPDLAAQLNSGYEMLERGELDQAQKLYEEMVRRDPGNPVALNNLAAILAKKGRYDEALIHLNQALGRAKGYRGLVDRVCDLESVCTAFRVSQDSMVGGDLEDLIKSNILMVKMASASPPRK